jgi:hypothetical protein
VWVDPSTFAADLGRLVGSPRFSDVHFVVGAADGGDRVVHAHRAVLVRRSSWLRAMLGSALRAEGQRDIRLPRDEESCWTVPTLTRVLQFLYTGCVEVEDAEALLPLARAAAEWRVEGLMARCETLLAGALDRANMLSLLAFADAHFLPNLRSAVRCFFHVPSNWEWFEAQPEFLEEFAKLPLETRRYVLRPALGTEYAYKMGSRLRRPGVVNRLYDGGAEIRPGDGAYSDEPWDGRPAE